MNSIQKPAPLASKATCRWINYVDVMDCDDLQKQVVEHLSAEALRLFFYPRDTAFRDTVLAENNAIAGCFHGEQLAGQAILLRNNTGEKFAQNYMLERPIPTILQDRQSAVITNAMVDPRFQGGGVMQATLNFISCNQRLFGVDAVFFITHINNLSMITAGLKAGFCMLDVGICRNNNEPMYLMVRQPLLSALPINHTVQLDLTSCQYKDVQDYLSDGWIGSGLNGSQLTLQAA